MNGNEAFKYYREKGNYSVRQFASLAEISPRAISYYENGEKQLTSIPVAKAIKIFDLFDTSIEEFYNTYYPFKDSVNLEVIEWQKRNPRELDYIVLKRRLYLRLAKIKERAAITVEHQEKVTSLYIESFKKISDKYGASGLITEEDYKKYVMPILYEVNISMHPLPEDRILKQLINEIYKSEMTVTDIAGITGISKEHLQDCMKGKYDLKSMHVASVLKICYLLNLDFPNVFTDK